ncbi:hypothetical protein HPB48_026763 [Haemaphysalis longicornis]|uniref:Uncharacterized protein n=1 Tax=Haemaphysalis longicornis TaxID=44386 RepID=A0A9J6HAB2_HAELO|nr:hypothetical protein HPB48_026763 [Haemaphysalis longicornis]
MTRPHQDPQPHREGVRSVEVPLSVPKQETSTQEKKNLFENDYCLRRSAQPCDPLEGSLNTHWPCEAAPTVAAARNYSS